MLRHDIRQTQPFMLMLIIGFLNFSMVILIHSFIHSGYFYSNSSSPLLLRGAPDFCIMCIDTVSELNTPKRYTQLYE